MSRATMPLVSVTIAWAKEIPGLRTPPTVVKAPNLKTSLRLSGLNIDIPSVVGLAGLTSEIARRDSTVGRTNNEDSALRIQNDDAPPGGRGHLRPGRLAAAAPFRRLPFDFEPALQDRGPVRGLH